MKKTILAASMIAAVSGIAVMGATNADDKSNNGKTRSFSSFKQLDESANRADFDATAPWKLPRGFSQHIVSDESALNIYLQPTYTSQLWHT